MKKLKILLTACGCPSGSTLIRKFKDNGEREVEIVGTDMSAESIGKFWTDKFYQVPAADSDEYIPKMLEIAKKEKPDVLFPESSYEIYPVSLNRDKFEALGIKVVASDPEPLAIAIDKYKMYEVLKGTEGVGMPEYYYPRNLDEFIDYARRLGYPKNPVCFKPHVSKGSRGFRILDESISRKDLLLNHKPISRYMSLNEFTGIFKEEKEFPDLIVMEFLKGAEDDAMSLCYKGDSLLVTVKAREQHRWGNISHGELLDKPEIVESVNKIISKIPLSYNISLQFIGGKLIEINPRTSTYIYQDDLNEPYLAVKLCLGEITRDQMRGYQSRVRIGRRMLRYMDQLFWDKDSVKFEV